MAEASPANSAVPSQVNSEGERLLTREEQEKLDKDTILLSDFKQHKLEKEAQKNWDLFYKRNTTNFFKDRHWTTREFEELCGAPVDGADRLTVLEVGCGVGNFVFPLIQELPNIFFYACDFSPRAVEFVQKNPLYSEDRCLAFQNDLTKHALTDHVPASGVDLVTMIFVLSAIHPDKMLEALRNIYTVVKPGGCVLFRDYGRYDHAMLRFTTGHKLADSFYVRQDGTRAYYFRKEMLGALFKEAGFVETANNYIMRETVNKKEGLHVPRVFVQGKFTKVTMATDHSNHGPVLDLCLHSSTNTLVTTDEKGGEDLKSGVNDSHKTGDKQKHIASCMDNLEITDNMDNGPS